MIGRALCWSYGLALAAVALGLCVGVGGCGGANPDEPSTERRVMQEAILAGGQFLADVDRRVGPVCVARTDANIARLQDGVLTPDTFAAAEAECRELGHVYRQARFVLEDLEKAADCYEAARDSTSLEQIAPCVAAVLTVLEARAQAIAGYDRGALLSGILGGLGSLAEGACTLPDFATIASEVPQ